MSFIKHCSVASLFHIIIFKILCAELLLWSVSERKSSKSEFGTNKMHQFSGPVLSRSKILVSSHIMYKWL